MAGLWLIVGGLNGLIAVGAGAYGWHSLGANDSVREIYMMGVNYQMWHALAILATGLTAGRPNFGGVRLANLAGLGFSLGIVLFSGTLYAYAVLGYIPVTGAAPVGGALLMAGWGLLMAIGWKTTRPRKAPTP